LSDEGLPEVLHGAVVPHAGWVCSGRVAGGTFATLARHTKARTFILTGTGHHFQLNSPATDASEAWTTPLGPVEVDVELRAAMNQIDGFATFDQAHVPEHSIEVQLPLMVTALGADIRIVPCLVPADTDAPRWGAQLGALLDAWHEPVVIVASSDLTHYGPGYNFTPRGTDGAARAWAYEENDQAMLDLITTMATDRIVPHALKCQNACGSGAIAVTVGVCRQLGADGGYVLAHTDSARELGSLQPDSVGYAGVVLG
jgi:hypothetical protein